MQENRLKRPELREKDIVRLVMEGILRKREDRLKEINELLGKRESLKILKFKRSEGFS
jgi:hypothetical protein